MYKSFFKNVECTKNAFSAFNKQNVIFLFFIYKDVSTLLLTLKYFTYLLRICIVNMLLLTC